RARFLFALETARFELDALRFELLAIGVGGAQRLAARQQKIAGESVLDADGFAHLAELRHAFEENDFHLVNPFLTSGRGHMLRDAMLRRARKLKMASAAPTPAAASRGQPPSSAHTAYASARIGTRAGLPAVAAWSTAKPCSAYAARSDPSTVRNSSPMNPSR